MKTASVVNMVYDDSKPPVPEVGMGATILMWTDRYAATITSVAPGEVEVQYDNAIRTDDHGMSDSQSYRYEPNPTASKIKYTLRPNGKWVRKGESTRQGLALLIGKRDHHHDFGF